MLTGVIDLAFNVGHALQIHPPDYVRSILGGPDSWRVKTCPPTELKPAEVGEWSKGLPELARILIPALPWRPCGLSFPFSDLLFRPSHVFRYPAGPQAPNPTPEQRWFFINGICLTRIIFIRCSRLGPLETRLAAWCRLGTTGCRDRGSSTI